MLRNFTVADILLTSDAALLFALVCFAPGFTVGYLTNVFDFRRRRLITQASLSTPIAISVVPIIASLLGRWPPLLWGILAASWTVFPFVLFRGARRIPRSWHVSNLRKYWFVLAIVLIWAVIAIGILVDLQIGHRLYSSVPTYDYSVRSAMTASAARRVPPANPFFASNPPVMLRYHYFWFLLCGLIMRIGGLSARQAMYGGTIWAGIALLSLVAICMKFFMRVTQNLERKILIAFALLLVTGLDLLPTIFIYLRYHSVSPDMEWWNEQITSWLDTIIWNPHHLSALVACMTGLLLLRNAAANKLQRIRSILIAGMAFASAAGLSVLVTFAFALFIALWLPFAALRGWWDDVFGMTLSGAFALLIALPYLKGLLGPATDASVGFGRFAALSFRDFPLGIVVVADLLKMPATRLGFLSVPLLPVNYFLELGFFFVVGLLRIQGIRAGRVPVTREEQTGWMLVFTSFVVGTFLRSTTMGQNDLGWRCFMLAQLILLLWGVEVVDQWLVLDRPRFPRMMRVAQICMVLGVLGTGYQMVILRMYPVLHDMGKVKWTVFSWVSERRDVGQYSFALRSAYEQLNASLASTAVVQYDPDEVGFMSHANYSGHNAAIGAPSCAAVFGGDPNVCKSRREEIVPLFWNPSTAKSAALDQTCRNYNIDVMIVDDTDEVWKQRDSWVWRRTPLLANQYVRAFRCGALAQQAALRPPS